MLTDAVVCWVLLLLLQTAQQLLGGRLSPGRLVDGLAGRTEDSCGLWGRLSVGGRLDRAVRTQG